MYSVLFKPSIPGSFAVKTKKFKSEWQMNIFIKYLIKENLYTIIYSGKGEKSNVPT